MNDRTRNEDIRTVGFSLNYMLSEKMNQSYMRWYGHMARMSEERQVIQRCRVVVDGIGGSGRPRTI